jgi:hypothetical protein
MQKPFTSSTSKTTQWYSSFFEKIFFHPSLVQSKR